MEGRRPLGLLYSNTKCQCPTPCSFWTGHSCSGKPFTSSSDPVAVMATVQAIHRIQVLQILQIHTGQGVQFSSILHHILLHKCSEISSAQTICRNKPWWPIWCGQCKCSSCNNWSSLATLQTIHQDTRLVVVHGNMTTRLTGRMVGAEVVTRTSLDQGAISSMATIGTTITKMTAAVTMTTGTRGGIMMTEETTETTKTSGNGTEELRAFCKDSFTTLWTHYLKKTWSMVLCTQVVFTLVYSWGKYKSNAFEDTFFLSF